MWLRGVWRAWWLRGVWRARWLRGVWRAWWLRGVWRARWLRGVWRAWWLRGVSECKKPGVCTPAGSYKQLEHEYSCGSQAGWCEVSPRTGWPGVSLLSLCQTASSVSVWQRIK